ncbi:SEC-C metal-binding domain-containing protein [Sporosarcina soli]|uniref:SEC-C metal-binding domain-containing protein n=1 Tax=Sporosarcina soli TaxID=334736 RepID=A0ABW0TKP5_9BACL
MIGRNDPCLCGSGKKYKKCCGAKGTDLVEMIVNEELDRILSGYFDAYSKGQDRAEMMRIMREWANRLSDSWEKEHIEEAASEFYLFIQNGKLWRTYMEVQLAETKRESVVAVLEQWSKPILLLAEIVAVEAEVMKVRELFGEKEYRLTRAEGVPADSGTLLFGIVLRDPRKGEDVVAPVSSMIFLAKWSKQTKKSLNELRESDLQKPSEEFLQDHILAIYELLIKRSQASMNELVEEMLDPSQLNALKELDSTMIEWEQTADSREIMHKLAVAYFLNENEQAIVASDFVVAALQTGVEIGIVQGEGLKEEIVRKFGPSKEGIDLYTEQLRTLFDAMMDSGEEPVTARVYEIGTDPRPTEKKLWETAMTTSGIVQPERRPGIAEGRAQLLAYEAYTADTEEDRQRLAKRASEIEPDLPDVLLMSAEMEEDPQKAAELYEKAIRQASKVFEPGDSPWQNIPNRPFMRATFAYGIHLFSCGDYDEAAGVFMDLVKMNRNDQQGARYEAIASLIHVERYKEAAELLVRYEKGSQQDATYLYLDWKLEHEASGGQSLEVEEMLKAAAQLNGHVMHLMTFKAKAISYPRHQSIEPGSVEEARYIWWLLKGNK